MTYRIYPVFALVLFFWTAAFAQEPQDGWQYIQNNDFVSARSAFEARLQQAPADEAALAGMIFLSETLQDHENYQKYANVLIRSNWAPQYVWLFGHVFEGPPEEVLSHELPENVRLPFVAQQADSMMRYRRFAESNALKNALVPTWNWAIAGPFSNVEGSGFVESTPVETRALNLRDTFVNDEGIGFGWLTRVQQKPGQGLHFSQLPRSSGLSTYYANTFITNPATRTVDLRITRGEPLKIWLDDSLLIERPRRSAPGQWDMESVVFTLPAGTHRLLLKLSEFPEEENSARLNLYFNDTNNYGENEAYTDESNFYFDQKNENTTGLVLRFTDLETGRLLSDLRSDTLGQYQPATDNWPVEFRQREYLEVFHLLAQEHSGELWPYFLLAKAFVKCQALEDGEAFLAFISKENPDLHYFRFLLAKFFDANGKSERAERLLSEMDTLSTPTFSEHFMRLQNIDQEQDEPRYVAAMEAMIRLSPTNWPILNRYLQFNREKGRKEQLKIFVRDFLKKYDAPKWRQRLAEYLEDESYKPESYKPTSDKEREKAFKTARKALRKQYNPNLYGQVIAYYKYREKTDLVIATYDEMLGIDPWDYQLLFDKASYLFESERETEALVVLQQLLAICPYEPEVCELIGDIYIEQKKEAPALYWYKKARKLSATDLSYTLLEKIEKIENRKKYTAFFDNINLGDIARDTSWMAAYPDEEAVISHYSQQLTYVHSDHKIEAIRKAAIHILNEAGAKSWTEADLRLIGNITSIKVLKKDGSVTSPDFGWGVAVFKNLQAGDVILVEGSGEQEIPNDIPGELLDISLLSWQAPVVHATLELLLPRDEKLYAASNRLDTRYTRRDTGEYQLLRWDWRQLPKIESEDAMPDNLDQVIWFTFSNTPDWSKIVQWYQRKTYCRTQPNYEVLEQARQLIRPGMTQAEIVEVLHTYITRDINYSYVPFLNSNYVPKTPGATLSGKVGDCKDVATLMISLLHEQGIPAWYTLVSTHSFSNTEPRPTIYLFNHAIVAYELQDGVLRFADLTTDYFPTGMLPNSDSDAWGLVIRDGENHLRRLPNDAMDEKVTRVEVQAAASIDAEGNLILDTDITRHGSSAGQWREIFMRANADDRRKQLSEYFGGGVLHHLDLEKSEFANLDHINEPLHSSFRLKAYHQLDRVADLHIMPLPLPLSTPTQKALFANKRANDLDADVLFELAPVIETVELAIPAGFTLAEQPRNRNFDTRFGSYELSFEKTNTTLRIRRKVVFKQRFIANADFQEFKQFYLNMLDSDDVILAFKSEFK